MFKKSAALILILLHLLTFGPIKECLAFSAVSASYRLSTGSAGAGGTNKAASSFKLTQDTLSESLAGKSQSASYSLNTGFIPTIQANPPEQTQIISNQTWQENSSKVNAFDLDDYFQSPDSLFLTYTANGSANINISIDSTTHLVSFSQSQSWFGTEKISFTATDSESNTTQSNEVTLQVQGVDNPPVLDYISDISVHETELVGITPHATDLDGDPITYIFSAPLDASGKWLTGFDDAGTYTVNITASDGIVTVSQPVKITVNNINRAPSVSLTLSKYMVNPNEEFTVGLSATDADNDAMSFVLKKDNIEFASGSLSGSPADPQNFTISFSNTGDHSITAIITDSGGLSVSDSKAVDVVDPNTNKEYINPVMGDFNGDSLTDLGLHDSQSGKWEICLSDKGVFRNAVDWLNNFGTSREWWPVGGDFNGDSKSDIGVYNITTGELKIALSNGNGFTAQGTAFTFSNASYSWQPFSGNFNGDKYTDFALYNKDTGEIRISLGASAGFGAFSSWGTDFGTGYNAFSGDFNGDSLSDICLFKKSSGEFKVAFSNTTVFVDTASWITGFAVNQDALISDFNNDGLSDIGYWDKVSLKCYYAISTGIKFIDKGVWLDSFGAGTDESVSTGDFDGNGITDTAAFDREQIGITRWNVSLSSNKPADLLIETNNGIGGKTKVSYTYSSEFTGNEALPFPIYVAKSISLIDTLPIDSPQETYTRSFNYTGGYYDAGEREFRGFAKVSVHDSITGNYSETYFYQGKPEQDAVLKGQIKKIVSYDGNSRKISETLNTYEIRKAGHASNLLGAVFLSEQRTTVWEENAVSLTTKDEFVYDNIGNILVQTNEGDVSKTGDEKSTGTTYATAYSKGLNRPLEVLSKDNSGAVVSKKTFEYDSKGNLTKDTLWILNPFTMDYGLSTVDYSYDSFGNLRQTANALGAATTTDYETTYYTYPVKVTNALGQSISYIYDPRFGIIKSVTDANGVITENIYDSLNRLTSQLVDSQPKVTYSYPDFNTKITTNAIGLSVNEYIDGLGRKYKTVSQGEDGNIARQISSEVYYNNRGLVEKESLAHYIDEDPNQITYTGYFYDIRGRIKKTIADFPGTLKDAESSINYIDPLYVETTDASGNRKGSRKDIFGNTIEVIEFTSEGVFHTYYEYDIQNNLIKTTDNQGSVTQIFYDSIGRKLKMIDPDMGTWSYEYDAIGNLIKQTDAKNQVLTFEYDTFNRLVKKSEVRGQITEILAVYSYDDTTKPNCIGRLSKVSDSSGSTEFFYDKLGKEIKSIKTVHSPRSIVDSSYEVLREYDVLDRLTKLTYPDGHIVQYSYDINSGLLEKVFSVDSGLSAVDYVKEITYTASGQIKTIKYGNGTQTDYTYGQDLRLSRIYTQGLSVSGEIVPVQDLNYIFDKNGNITTLTDNLRSNIRAYTYDDLDRLTYANNLPSPSGGYTNFNYQYDSIGNMIYKSDVGVMSYGAGGGPHALTSAGGYTYQYDSNGNMTQGKNKTLEYDAENRLTKVSETNGAITAFTYDGDGGRVKKITSAPEHQLTSETAYIGSLYEVTNLTEISDSADMSISTGTIKKHIFAGANRIATISSPLEGLSPQGTVPQVRYYHSDHLGSSSIITDASGKQVGHYEYTPYGTIAQGLSPEGTVPITHLFTGKELDSTGLYYYGARYYDPEIGRFITADTVVQSPFDPQSLNRYSYCRNNPMNYVDPSGHSWKSFWKSLGKAFASGAAGGIVTGLITVLSGGTLTPLAIAFGGMVSGASNAALNGAEWQGVLIGAGLGFGLGYGLGGLALSGYGFAAAMIGGAIGLGGAVNSYQQGGWESVGDFVGGVIGGIGGFAVGYSVGTGLGKALQPQNPQQQKAQSQSALRTDQKPEFKAGTRVWRNGEIGKELDGVIGPDGTYYKSPSVPAGKRITVLGSRDDLQAFKGNPKYNVLDPDINFSWPDNVQFLYDAAKNGEHFIFMRSPTAWNDYTTTVYGQPSRLPQEYNFLQNLGVENSRITKMYSD